MKKRKIIPIITATFMAASLLIPNTAFAVPTAPKPTATDPNYCSEQQQGRYFDAGQGKDNATGGNGATTRMHYTSVNPGDPHYNALLASINSSFPNSSVHCEEGSPIYATQTASGLFPQIAGKTKDSEVAITDSVNWVGGFPKDALKRFVANKRKLLDYYEIKEHIPTIADAPKRAFLDDIDPDAQDKKEQEFNEKHKNDAVKPAYQRANATGLEAFCNIECDVCEKPKCKPGECEPPETMPRRYFIDNPEYKHDRASRSDVAQKDMPMSWTMFDNSAKGTDGYPLNIQYSAEDAPSDGHIEKDVVITPFGEMMNKLRQGIGEYAKFKNPAPSVEATNAYQQELIQRAIEHKKRTDKTKTGITIPDQKI